MTGSTALVNIGTLLSGRLEEPVLDADAILVQDGRIAAIGRSADIGEEAPRIDVGGSTVMPGLFDNHVHPVIGDYTPRQHQSQYLEGYVHGGVTSLISAGEVHTPGRPKDRHGTKALAVLAARAFANLRPLGARVHAGALLLEDGLTEQDFAELAEQGVHLVGEIGISSVQDPETAAQMTRWAQAAGMTVVAHVGGASVPTSRSIDADFVLAVRPDVAAHVNGGPTAAATEDVARILDETDAYVEVVHNGNVRAARDVAGLVTERDALHRLLVGTDSPAGSGVVPLGVIRTVSWLASLGGVPGPQAIAAASGNVARARRVDGGTVEEGGLADLVICDAPDGSQASDAVGALEAGDTIAVSGVLVDGEVVVRKSRNTPPPQRVPTFPGA
jgi:enamidase